MTCNVREARNSFSKLRRRAAGGEEILIAPENSDSEAGVVSLVPTWFIDELVAKTTDWTVDVVSEPGSPVALWSLGREGVREEAGPGQSSAYVLEHRITGISGVGSTRAAAAESLIDGLLEYADEYYSDLPFYLSARSGRREHYPYVRAIKRCAGNREALRSMLDGASAGKDGR